MDDDAMQSSVLVWRRAGDGVIGDENSKIKKVVLKTKAPLKGPVFYVYYFFFFENKNNPYHGEIFLDLWVKLTRYSRVLSAPVTLPVSFVGWKSPVDASDATQLETGNVFGVGVCER